MDSVTQHQNNTGSFEKKWKQPRLFSISEAGNDLDRNHIPEQLKESGLFCVCGIKICREHQMCPYIQRIVMWRRLKQTWTNKRKLWEDIPFNIKICLMELLKWTSSLSFAFYILVELHISLVFKAVYDNIGLVTGLASEINFKLISKTYGKNRAWFCHWKINRKEKILWNLQALSKNYLWTKLFQFRKRCKGWCTFC